MPQRDNGSTSLFRALSNYRRQAVIYHVSRREKSLSDLATEIGKLEAELDDETYSSKVRKHVYTSLYQTHLPRLDDWRLIE